MRLVGHRDADGSVVVADLGGDGVATAVAALEEFWRDPFAYARPDLSRPERRIAADELLPVPPVPLSARVLCVGLNYAEHIDEALFADDGRPEHPTIFGRWTASLTTSGAVVPLPPHGEGLDWEGEVVAWVGRRLLDATAEEATAAVVGYSTFNDLTARRAQKLTSQWILGKNADASGPLGPLVPAAEVGELRDGLRLRTRVNGETVQDASTAQMIFGVGETLALASRTMTLHPGDLLATGTPSGVGYARTPPRFLQTGDRVEVEVDRLGTLANEIGPPHVTR